MAIYRAHKLILASGSKYFLELFVTEDSSKITQVSKALLYQQTDT